MVERLKITCGKTRRDEAGQALILVLILVLLGSIIIAPLLSYMGTGLKTGRTFQNKTAELYAADAGIEDGVYQIKYNKIKTKFPGYSPYDYADPSPYAYDLADEVNDIDPVHVTIQNVWVPTLSVPASAGAAQQLLDDNKLIITGSASGSNYAIKITYNRGASDNPLQVLTVGVWLPGGFSYVAGTCDIEDNTKTYYCAPAISDWDGGKALEWDFGPGILFAGSTVSPLQDAFPNFTENSEVFTSTINFTYTGPSTGAAPNAIAWISTLGIDGNDTTPYIAWDADQRIYKITSTAGSTVVETYIAKNELRHMQSAIDGDYFATGNSNLSDTDSDRNREHWNDPSSSTVTSGNIPTEADVAFAYLYWTGWKNDSSTTFPLNDTCSNLTTNWDAGNAWSVSSNHFRGHYDISHTGTDLTLKTEDLSSYSSGGGVTIFWDQWVNSSGSQNQQRVPNSDDSNTGAFTSSQFWSKVDETSADDSNYITGVTDTGGRCTFGSSSFSIPSNAVITDLTIYFRHKRADWGTAKAGASIKAGSTYYDNLGMVTPGDNWTTSNYTASTNPDTGLAWTVADINGTGSHPLQGFGVSSNDFNPNVRFSMVYAQVNYTVPIDASNGLDIAFSDDNGTTWSDPVEVFRGDIGSTSNVNSYTIPSQFLIDTFKFKFTLIGFSGSGLYCYLDDIKIVTADMSVVFKMDSNGSGVLANAQQVYLDDSGEAQEGNQELKASKCQLVENFSGTSPHGFSYSSFCDVTALVREYSRAPTAPNLNWPGYASYWVGGIYADASPEDEWAYACWSLVIIYTSSNTQGHQLYLYDQFTYSNHDVTNGVNVDFDHDGEPGGTISGFIVPERLTGVAGITVNNQGSNYTSVPTVTISGGGGSGATATANVVGNKVTSITVTSQGTGYVSVPSVNISGGGGTGATAAAMLDANAGKITTFSGEGDVWYTNDYVEVNGTKIWDGVTCSSNSEGTPTNAFNSTSLGLSTHDGIDVDTLGIDPPNGEYITWASGILNTGDTSAQIDMVTHQDVWNLVYIIISFRSETTTGGAISYLIKS
jgi:hypothetical protein